MKPFENIKKAKYFIEKLTESLERMRSDKQKSFQIDMINAFINLVNTAELLTNANNQTDIMDSLLLSRIADQLEDREFRSMNWSQNVIVVERNDSGTVKLMGTIDTDSIVQANYLLNKGSLTSKLSLNIKNKKERIVGTFNAKTSKALVDFMYESKMDTIDMVSVVESIDSDITYHPDLNMERVVKHLRTHDIKNSLATNTQPYSNEKWTEMVTDLLSQFKETMKWK